jgi:hypothetical protein
MKAEKVLMTAITLLLLFSILGCGSSSSVQKDRGQLNLAYEFKAVKEERKDYPIGIVKADIPPASKVNQQQQIQNPLIAAALQKQNLQQAILPPPETILALYSNELKLKLSSGIEELITRKGFNIIGPYDSFEDITFRDKQKTFMTLIPKLNILPENKITSSESNSLTKVTRTTGIIQVGGDYVIDFVEPLTREKLLSKRINLSDLGIQKEYISERQVGTSSGVIGMALQAAASSQTYTDNYDKAVTEAINEFYTKSMGKLEIFIESDEIISYKEEVAKLKGLKRF